MKSVDAARIMAADCLCFRARRVARAVTRVYDAALRPSGLHATQLTLLNVVSHAGAEGMPMGRLAEALALEISTLTRNLRPLQSEGLIELGISPADRRVRVVRLTAAGAQRLVDSLPLWQLAHAEVLRQLGPDAAAMLKGGLDQAAAALSDAAKR